MLGAPLLSLLLLGHGGRFIQLVLGEVASHAFRLLLHHLGSFVLGVAGLGGGRRASVTTAIRGIAAGDGRLLRLWCLGKCVMILNSLMVLALHAYVTPILLIVEVADFLHFRVVGLRVGVILEALRVAECVDGVIGRG